MPSATTELQFSYPKIQTAIIQDDKGKLCISNNVALPELKPDMILVKTMAVALNPVDYKMAENFPSPGAIDGCDFSGIILEIGSEAAKSHSFKVGQRVCGAVHGSNPIDLISGSFAEFVAVIADLLLKMPDEMSFETGAVIGGIAPATVGLALYTSLKLSATPEEPTKDPSYVLIYGGSTATGTMAIQLLKRSGLKVVTTCSPKNFAFVKSYGADEAFDYKSPTCVDDIRAYTNKSLRHVLDTITEAKSMKICYACIGRAGGRYTCLEMYPDFGHTRKTVKPEMVMGLAISGRQIALDRGYESDPNPEYRKFGKMWFRTMQKLVDEGKITPHPIRLVPGKFEGILNGLQLLKRKEISAEKIVVSLQ